MSARSRRLAVLGVLAALALGGCGDGAAGGGGREPITARAVAAIALDHLPADDTSSRGATYVDRTDPPGHVGADLRFGGGEGDDGDLVRVTVTPDRPLPGCATLEGYDGCAALAGDLVLAWDEVEPEEDPGLVVVRTERDGATVAALLAGPSVEGDPRRQDDLAPLVETLTSIVRDERLAPRVPGQVLAAGEALDGWDGGERAEGELDEVLQTGAGLVGTFFLGRGDGWTYAGTTPDLDELGPGAVGGRTVGYREGPIGPGVLDVVAASEMPAWAEPATCREGWRCSVRGDTHLVWRPARADDPGESWLLQPSELGGVAGLHVAEGRRMPAGDQRIRFYSGFVMYAAYLTDPIEPQAIGLTTTREALESAEARSADHEAD